MNKKNNKLKEAIIIIVGIIIILSTVFLNYKYNIDDKLIYIYLLIAIIIIFKFVIDHLIEKIKLLKLEKKEIINKLDLEYYRNILKENSPALLSIIHDRKINNKKDLIACVLYLEKEGYLKITNKIEYTNKDYSNLSQSLKYIIEQRDYLFTDTHQYIEEIKQKKYIPKEEYLNDGRVKILSNTIKRKIKDENNRYIEVDEVYYREEIYDTQVYLVFLDINGTYKFIGAYHDWTKTNLYKNNFYQLWKIKCYKELEEKGYYKERMKFYVSILTYFLIILLLILPLFALYEKSKIEFMSCCVISIFFILLLIISKIISKEKNKYVMTQKGYEMYIKLNGLKRFISDFSSLDKRQVEEISLWDEYLIYCIILNKNNKLIKTAKEKINNLYKK